MTPHEREIYEERAAIMQHVGGLPRAEAERLAREQPWATDPAWGLPRSEQMGFDDPEFRRFRRDMQQILG